MKIEYAGEEADLGIVDIGSLSEWFDYETRKIELTKPDGSKEICFRIFVDGDWEVDKPTLEDAKKYVKELKESQH